ncbi:hypothetical protein F4861DRAFT_292698 [Xylaria intraflava]|nr:hypothetical protein F4861DRAFT_292698 [Xylaria intraflava]
MPLRLTKKEGVPILSMTITASTAQTQKVHHARHPNISIAPRDGREHYTAQGAGAEVHIQLPLLLRLKAITDRFTKPAVASRASLSSFALSSAVDPKLELSANVHGELQLRLDTDALNVEL